VMTMAGNLPAKFEGTNNDFYFAVWFGQEKARPDVLFSVSSRGGKYEPYYATSRNPGFTVGVNGQELTMNIAPQLLKGWPDTITTRFDTSYFPLNSKNGCGDFMPDSLTKGLTLKIQP
jgi:hypothetical protein